MFRAAAGAIDKAESLVIGKLSHSMITGTRYLLTHVNGYTAILRLYKMTIVRLEIVMCLLFLLKGYIRITCPCDLYPLTPHFYIVKLGFTGVYIIFLF